MNTKLQSLIRHILTALGTILVFLGLGKYSGLVEFLINSLDGIFVAVTTIVGVGMQIWGFLKNKGRFLDQ